MFYEENTSKSTLFIFLQSQQCRYTTISNCLSLQHKLSGLRMRSITRNQFPLKNLQIDCLLSLSADSTYSNLEGKESLDMQRNVKLNYCTIS